jgi:hypothetical protein
VTIDGERLAEREVEDERRQVIRVRQRELGPVLGPLLEVCLDVLAVERARQMHVLVHDDPREAFLGGELPLVEEPRREPDDVARQRALGHHARIVRRGHDASR